MQVTKKVIFLKNRHLQSIEKRRFTTGTCFLSSFQPSIHTSRVVCINVDVYFRRILGVLLEGPIMDEF